jgi:UDP-N-acetylbacillosamine N-acetyltransferase
MTVMREKIVIWGASSQALIIADIIRSQDVYEIVGLLDSVNPERAGTEFLGAPILGGEEQLDVLLRQGVKHLIVGVGSGHARLRLADSARSHGYQLATTIHPRAIIAGDVTVGAGTVIMAGVVINPGANLGDNVIVSTCASVEHECTIAEGVTISAGVHMGGRVRIGRAATVEIGATIARRISIGGGSVVGAGSVVLHDIPDGVLAYGTPARVIRTISGYDY